VLDTDGVNAFAAPGGFIHVTRGALALIQNEAELADVLAHEVGHVTAKHTIRAMQKGKLQGAAAESTRSAFLRQVANKAYEITLENSFDRGDEMAADKVGIGLASQVGYAPAGLGAFLTRLSDRNKDLKERSGMFASHPDMTARLDALARLITSQKLAATATVAARYSQAIRYRPVAVGQVAQVAPPAAAAETKPTETKPGGTGKFGLGGLNPLGREKSGSQTVASAGSRGVNPDRDAKGGPNKSIVVVTVTAAEIAEFRKGITG
jgi:predicted Zn-dependent protease